MEAAAEREVGYQQGAKLVVFQGVSSKWRQMREMLRFKFAPQVAELMLGRATARARLRLTSEPIEVLVDTSVLGKAITHETAWVSTGVKRWGSHDVPTGYSARVPVHAHDPKKPDYEQLLYLTGITHLARRGCLALRTSAELLAEQDRHPVGMTRGYGYFDLGLFDGLDLKSVDGHAFGTMGPSWMNLPSPKDQQQTRLRNSGDELYEALLKLLGEKDSLDAWHIRTAERHGLFCFLTMDFALRRKVEQLKVKEPLRSLRTRVMTPKELARELKVEPVPPYMLSYNHASYIVRSDLSMPGSKRRPRSGYRRPKRS